jgi:hypothetical protein
MSLLGKFKKSFKAKSIFSVTVYLLCPVNLAFAQIEALDKECSGFESIGKNAANGLLSLGIVGSTTPAERCLSLQKRFDFALQSLSDNTSFVLPNQFQNRCYRMGILAGILTAYQSEAGQCL